jgi:ABC-2 type transport system permease protein
VPTRPQLFPLQLLRGSIEYLELVGALLAIILGYGMVAKEKQRGTLQLLFSRPIRSREVAVGKLLALAVVWLVALTSIFLVTIAGLLIIGNAPLHGVDFMRILVTLGLAWVYMLFWSFLAMALAAVSKRLTSALIVTLVLWLIVVLILPQIGDTMDPDNQVPGGLFKTLQVDKTHENLVISHFTGYETTRNAIEVSSITKQFERPTFAYLGMNETYNQKPLGFVSLQLWPNMLSLFLSGVGATVLALWTCTKRNLLKRGEL